MVTLHVCQTTTSCLSGRVLSKVWLLVSFKSFPEGKKHSTLWVMGLIWERDIEIWEICMLFALQQLRMTMAGRNMCRWDCGSSSTAIGTIVLRLNIAPDTGCNPHCSSGIQTVWALWGYFHIQMSCRSGICIRQQTLAFNLLKLRENVTLWAESGNEQLTERQTDQSRLIDRIKVRQFERDRYDR